MKILKLLLFFLIFLLFPNAKLEAQYLNLFGGVKFPEFKNSNVQLAYRDESPAPDTFYSNKTLKNQMYYTIGVSYDNFSHEKKIYVNAIGNINFGELFGFDVGLSVGYPLYLNKSKSLSFVPCLTGGITYMSKGLGELINNTTYI